MRLSRIYLWLLVVHTVPQVPAQREALGVRLEASLELVAFRIRYVHITVKAIGSERRFFLENPCWSLGERNYTCTLAALPEEAPRPEEPSTRGNSLYLVRLRRALSTVNLDGGEGTVRQPPPIPWRRRPAPSLSGPISRGCCCAIEFCSTAIHP